MYIHFEIIKMFNKYFIHHLETHAQKCHKQLIGIKHIIKIFSKTKING